MAKEGLRHKVGTISTERTSLVFSQHLLLRVEELRFGKIVSMGSQSAWNKWDHILQRKIYTHGNDARCV